VKIIRQLATFLLGITVGVGLYSLLRFWPALPGRWALHSLQTSESRPNHALTPAWEQRAEPSKHLEAPPTSVVAVVKRVASLPVVELPSWPQPEIVSESETLVPKRYTKPASLQVASGLIQTEKNEVFASSRVANSQQTAQHSAPVEMAVSTFVPPPPPELFRPIGYVEKADGQLEAIVLQENEIQVVHLGDEIGGRYRVTKITPQLVSAVDETEIQVPMTAPSGRDASDNPISPKVLATNSGSESPTRGNPAIGAHLDVDPKRIQPALRISNQDSMPQSIASSESQQADNSLGYVEKSDGRIEAILADGDSVRLVPTSPAIARNRPQDNRSAPTGIAVAAAESRIEVRHEGQAENLEASDRAAANPMHDFGKAIFRHLDPGNVMSSDEKPALDGVLPLSGYLKLPANVHPSSPHASNQPQTTQAPMPTPLEMNTLGFVETGDGNVAVVSAQANGVNLDWKSASSTGRLRDVLLSSFDQGPGVNKVNESSPHAVVRNVNFPSASTPSEIEPIPGTSSPDAPVEASQRNLSGYRESPATFIFQTLGYVKLQNGEVKAIVAEGSETYLVKQGETFAAQYRATSVDPFIVLAVKVSMPKRVPGFVSTQTDFAEEVASNQLHKLSHSGSSSLGLMTIGGLGKDFRSALAPTSGVNLFNALPVVSDEESNISPKP
jgi:hypothetical protein